MGVLPKPSQLKKTSKATAADHATERLVQLSKEENKLVRKLNTIKDEHEKAKQEIAEERRTMTEAHDSFVGSLRSEVEELERRKRVALEAIVDRTPEFDEREKKLKARERVIQDTENDTRRKNSQAASREHEAERELAGAAKSNAQAERTRRQLKELEESLRQKHIAFDNEKKAHNKEMLEREMKLNARENDVKRAELGFAAREESLQRLGKEIHNRRRLVDSQYDALLEAKKHLAKKPKKK